MNKNFNRPPIPGLPKDQTEDPGRSLIFDQTNDQIWIQSGLDANNLYAHVCFNNIFLSQKKKKTLPEVFLISKRPPDNYFLRILAEKTLKVASVPKSSL